MRSQISNEQNEQNALKCPRMSNTTRNWPKCPRNLKNRVFLLSLRVFLPFSDLSWVFCLFLRFQLYFGHFISFRGYCAHFGGVLFILKGFRIFSTFVVHFSHFSSSKRIILEVLVYL